MKNYIGVQSETVVRVALEEMKAQERIQSFRQQDLPGIDFFVTLTTGTILPLQVKSSIRHGRKHRQRYPDIPVIVTQILRHYPGNALRLNRAKIESPAMVRLVRRVKCQLEEILNGSVSGNGNGNGNGHH